MITKPPGIEDIFPDKIDHWNHVIHTSRGTCARFNFREVILPVMEFTEVFARGIGDETDIVSKEMFSFEDRGNRNLTLRPEGTAGMVRAYCENGEYNRLSVCKFFYIGPMFRAEKPQKGRLRQFNQLGVELFGSDDPFHDAEVISLMNSIARDCKIESYTILINSIGCPACRADYIGKLKDFYSSKKESLCPDCVKRLDKNTLRLLDCKVESCKKLRNDAPVISSHLCTDCAAHYASVKEHLSKMKIEFTEDPYLVRGLDYYSRTTFEFVTTALGGQNAFAAGGRYNGLVETFGGKPTPAVGFAAGLERIMLITEKAAFKETRLDAYIIHAGEAARERALALVTELRKTGLTADVDPSVVGMKSQMKKAERERSRYALIIGENEIAGNFYTVKNLDSGEQRQIPFDKIIEECAPSGGFK